MQFRTQILTVFLTLSFHVLSQTVYLQDTWQGGISCAGANVGHGLTAHNYNIDLFIDSGSIVKRAFLIAGTNGMASSINLLINETPLTLDSNTRITNGFLSTNNQVGFSSIHCLDISEIITSSVTSYSLFVPAQDNDAIQHFKAFYIVVQYENSALPYVNATLLLNNSNVGDNVTYQCANLNAVSNQNDIGFAFVGWAFCNIQFDGTNVRINNFDIGLVGGDEFNSPFFCSGSQGHFYFQNDQLFALGDDISNNSMNGSDAIANIQDYVGNNTSTINIEFVHQSPNTIHEMTNPIVCAVLAYTSPCQPFETSLLTSDTTTCTNSPLQLGASGGIAYEWLPQNNLSCYDCPNPVFLGDSTINYTVRIWSTDSCSVVKPVRVRVLPQPNFESIDVTESLCGFESGSIAGASTGLSLPHSYQINNSVPQNNFSFSNLSAGQYTLTVTDANGCSRDSTVQITEINNVQAAFTVNPSSGAAPLQVQTQNTSQNATEYQWFWENQISTLQNPSITLDTAGVYTLTLVASNGAEHCNDTTSALIFVEEPFVVFAYTYVTDEADIYQIYLSGVSEYRYDLYALDGKLVYQKSGNVEAAGFVDLWEISGVSSGMYVFRVRVKDNAGHENDVEGKVVVVR